MKSKPRRVRAYPSRRRGTSRLAGAFLSPLQWATSMATALIDLAVGCALERVRTCKQNE
jgi:hypothetical protein